MYTYFVLHLYVHTLHLYTDSVRILIQKYNIHLFFSYLAHTFMRIRLHYNLLRPFHFHRIICSFPLSLSFCFSLSIISLLFFITEMDFAGRKIAVFDVLRHEKSFVSELSLLFTFRIRIFHIFISNIEIQLRACFSDKKLDAARLIFHSRNKLVAISNPPGIALLESDASIENLRTTIIPG